MDIKKNIEKIKTNIPNDVEIVAISKTKPVELIEEAYKNGHKVFGENRPQELQQKQKQLPKDIKWHFIGHPQSKQVKYFAPFVELIHGVDSLKLLTVINKEAVKNKREINCLLQFHIAQEETKFGLTIDEANEILSNENYKKLENIKICGVMGMATYTDDKEQIKSEFSNLKNIFNQLKVKWFANTDYFKEISMGMSNDYAIAIEQGSTMLRIGSLIFGER